MIHAHALRPHAATSKIRCDTRFRLFIVILVLILVFILVLVFILRLFAPHLINRLSCEKVVDLLLHEPHVGRSIRSWFGVLLVPNDLVVLQDKGVGNSEGHALLHGKIVLDLASSVEGDSERGLVSGGVLLLGILKPFLGVSGVRVSGKTNNADRFSGVSFRKFGVVRNNGIASFLKLSPAEENNDVILRRPPHLLVGDPLHGTHIRSLLSQDTIVVIRLVLGVTLKAVFCENGFALRHL
mmetsp:Transcript_32737/g.63887  ORF Transcript_32737/g.63887 Transcript_32737/m.63887 type:complete len:240 (+) Transcript_32737:3-722(+)